MKLTTPIKVRYGETDMMGIVYHANYLLYFEDARTDFLERIGFPYAKIEEAGYMCPIRNVEISYGAPNPWRQRSSPAAWSSAKRSSR